jgi:hypothetical protein
MYYVYKLIDPRNQKTFYVGKGTKNRMYKHEQYSLRGKLPNGNKDLYDKILEIKCLNLEIIYEKVFETKSESDSYLYENKLINKIGIENLCNVVNDKLLIGIANNTKNSNWYYNDVRDEYRLFHIDDEIPTGFKKGSPRTTVAMQKWWDNLDDEKLIEYKKKMSKSVKNSEKHKFSVSRPEYKEKISSSLKSSEKFQTYNEIRKGSKRGKYNESDKNIKRRKSSALFNEIGEIVIEFKSLNEVCEYFNIKISTASVWIKQEKKVNDLVLKSC